MGYLVIGRKVGERILIGEDIEILITDISNNERKVDVAIKAPKELKIIRKVSHVEEQNADRIQNNTAR